MVAPEKALHGGGVRHDDQVVLVLSAHVRALGLEHAENFHGRAGAAAAHADADDFAHGIVVGKEAVGGGLSQHADLGGGTHVEVGEHGAFRQGPGADGEVIHAFAHDAGAPVVFAGRDLRALADFRADGQHAGNFVLDGEGVFHRKRAGAAETGKNAAAVDAAGKNLDDVLAEGGDARLDLGLRGFAEGDHGDDRADADDDAEHGQHGPHFIPAQGAEGDFDDGEVSHDFSWPGSRLLVPGAICAIHFPRSTGSPPACRPRFFRRA